MAKQHRDEPSRVGLELGAAITRARDARGWSQSGLAKRANVGQSVISRAERGTAWPDPPSMEKLLDALGTTLAGLFVERGANTEAGALAEYLLVLDPDVRWLLAQVASRMSGVPVPAALAAGREALLPPGADPELQALVASVERVWRAGGPDQVEAVKAVVRAADPGPK